MASWQSGAASAPKSKRSMVAALAAVDRAPLSAKLAGRNTLDCVGADGRRRIRLHQTDILTFAKHGLGFVIDTGGWNTLTTRDRLNAYLPDGYSVFTHRGRLYLRTLAPTGLCEPYSWEFRQTVTVTASGKVRSDVTPETAAKLTKQIDAYMAAWRKRGLPTAEESGGDPWIFTEGKVDASVMLDWIKSKYVHRRLYAMALAYAGLNPCIWLAMADGRGGMRAIDYGRIRRYVRACLGL